MTIRQRDISLTRIIITNPMPRKKKPSKKPEPPKAPLPEPEPEKQFDFGGLPQRDLKKNLGCG